MYLPINGRIAIIDNEIKEAEPLMKVFSNNRIPYLFINGGDMDWLPEQGCELNDIRLVFLDLNLTGDRTPDVKEVKSTLYPILNRVISKNNFPYSIILWSKQENEYSKAVEELFEKELSDRKPISIRKFIKSDFFELNGESKTQSTNGILDQISLLIKENQAYSTLIYWENKIHKSADNVLQDIFTAYDNEIWTHKSNFIISKLGQAYLGFKKHKLSNYSEKIKGALQAFNVIFNDTLEYNISVCSNIQEQEELTFDDSLFDANILTDTINDRLLSSKSSLIKENIDYTGTVSEDKNPKSDQLFETVFNESFDRFSVIQEINDYENITENKKGAAIQKAASSKRKKIRENWQKIYLVLTPLCDKVQDKQRNVRVVKGFIIDKAYKKNIDSKSEALYISPSFYDSTLKSSRIIVLNFRYFFTFNGDTTKLIHIDSIFRLRHSVVSEVQSKLARHVSRQGILYVE